MNNDTFRFFDKVGQLENGIEKLEQWIEDLSKARERGELEKRVARKEMDDIASTLETCAHRYQALEDEASDEHEQIMASVRSVWGKLEVDLEGLRDRMK